MTQRGEPADFDSGQAVARHLEEAFASGDAERARAAIEDVASAFRALLERTPPAGSAVAEESATDYIAESRF